MSHGDVIIESAALQTLATKQRREEAGAASSAQQLYESLALPPGSRTIRLLELLEATECSSVDPRQPPPPLEVRLRVARLEESPQFNALSYVWGTSSTTTQHKVLCLPQRCYLDITSNCYAALWQIRKHSGDAAIWVDSICINQEDDIEKSHQIGLMGEIYTWAVTTYVWLGPGTRESDRVMTWLRRSAALWRTLDFARVRIDSGPDMDRAISKHQRRCLKAPFSRLRWLAQLNCYRFLGDLLDREWSKRAWTFQEIILSPTPVILCGDNMVSWDAFISTVYNLEEKWVLKRFGSRTTASEAVDRWQSMIDLWLDFPRKSRWNNKSRRNQLGVKRTFGEHIDDLNQLWNLPLGLRLFHTVACTILATSYASAWGYASYVAIKGLLPSLKFGTPTLWIKLIISWLSATCVYVGIACASVRFCTYILLGSDQKRLLRRQQDKSRSDQGGQILRELGAIQVALRERVSSVPQDRSFALSGLLSGLGVVVSPVDYKRTVEETYQLLLHNMIDWNPRALAMIMDAGAAGPSDASSWVPQWNRRSPSAWLTSKYTFGSSLAEIRSVEEPRYRISGQTLRLQSRQKDIVTFRIDLPLAESPVESSETSNLALEILFYWIDRTRTDARRDGPYEIEKSYVYAVLRGLTPAYRQRIVNSPNYNTNVNVNAMRLPRHPLSMAPCDFTNQKDDFEIFCGFYDKCVPRRSDVHVVLDLRRDEMFANMSRAKGSRAYFANMLNAVVNDKRCLFILGSGYIGCGPLAMMENDELHLLDGVHTPMVLRRSADGETFTVIGAALVHGLMLGEEDSGTWKEITLV